MAAMTIDRSLSQGLDASFAWKNITRAGLYGALLVFLVCMTLLAFITHSKPDSFNELSRLAAIESLVERGTWAITDSGITEKMDDKALWNGEFYSDKTPVFTAMTAVPYYFFHNIMGAEIDTGNCDKEDRVCSYWWFSYLMVAIPASAMLALFYYVGRQLNVSAIFALMTTLALGLGTMVLPYSTVYNSHVPGAAYLFVGFVGLILPGLSDRSRRIVLIAAGFFAGLAVATDLPSLFLSMGLCVIVLIRHRRYFPWFASGVVIPLLLTGIFNFQMHQSMLPIYFRPGVYTWGGSPWLDAVAGRDRPEIKDWWPRIFNTTVGDHGLVVTWPLVLFPLVGLLGQAFHKRSSYRLEALVVLGVIGLHLASFLFTIDGFGGRAYGIRYLISFFPLLFFFTYSLYPLIRKYKLRWAYWLLFVVAFLVSFASTAEGTMRPWSGWHPVFYLEMLEVRPYVRLTSPLIWRPKHQLEAEIGPGIFIIGYDMAPRRSKAGEKALLSVVWQSTQVSTDARVKVFVHVRDADNQTVTGADHWILENYAVPSSRWERLIAANSVIRDDAFLDLPDYLLPGTYRILVGLYDPDTLDRLPVINDQSGENAVYLGDLVIH
jgi:hypothetical protein